MNVRLEIGAIYEHYKGKQYRVLGLAVHSETLEELVYYECLYPNEKSQFWVRPIENFLENIVVEGVVRPRFQKN